MRLQETLIIWETNSEYYQQYHEAGQTEHKHDQLDDSLEDYQNINIGLICLRNPAPLTRI